MKQVVVVGGGFAGAKIAKTLQHQFDVTLIDTKDYFEYTPSILRIPLKTNVLKHIRVKHASYLKKGKIITTPATTITKTHVITKDLELPYDYLVLASGAKYAMPKPEVDAIRIHADDLKKSATRMHHASSAVIIGGGLVGVELAGEIAHYMPNVQLTIVHPKDSIIDRNAEKAIKLCEKYLLKKGVNMIYNDKVVGKKGVHYLTEKKQEVRGDIAFLCAGIRSSTHYLEEHFKHILNERGFVKTMPTLLAEGEKNIFVAGDMTEIKEEKLAQVSEKHANVIIHNIKAMEKKKPLKHYEPKKRPEVISLGPRYAVFQYKNIIISGIIPAIIKKCIEWKGILPYKASF